MRLMTQAIERKLRANGANRDQDHAPVLKVFNPTGGATWLFSELGEDGDTLFGLCDLGMGFPELGYASLAELQGVRVRFGLGLERDLWFKGKAPLSVYADAARATGRIVEDARKLGLEAAA